MRILLINQYAGGPGLGMEYRPNWMAREWQRQGHHVLVVAGDVSHLRRDLPLGRSNVAGVPYLVLRTSPYERNGAMRFANITSFMLQLFRHQRALVRWDPDVVVASSTHPMDTRPALTVARKARALFVHEVHDLWPLTPVLLGGIPAEHPVIRAMQHEEDHSYRNADLVVSLLPKTEAYMVEHGLRPGRWAWVPNGADPVTFKSEEPSAAVVDACERIGQFSTEWASVLVYAGGHGQSNALGSLLDVAPAAADMSVGIVLIGHGPEKEGLSRRAAALDNVLMLDPVERGEVPAVLAKADFGYVGAHPTPLYRFGVSMNKIYDYMGAGLPIVEHLGAGNSPTRDADCGVAADPNVPGDLLRALKETSASTPAEREQWAENGRRYVAEFASQRRLARSMTREFEKHMGPATSANGRSSDRSSAEGSSAKPIATRVSRQEMTEAMEWDVRNWSKAAVFWLQHVGRPIRGSRVLEVGGRDGGLSIWFARLGAEAVVCTDLNGPSELARDNIQRAGFAGVITTATADVTDLQYHEEFDFVVFKSVLGGVGGVLGPPGQRAAVDHIHQALKPGGQLLFAENLSASALHQNLRRRFVAWGDRWLYPCEDDLRDLLAEFADVRLDSFGVAGALGRSERQRDLLAHIDSKILDRAAPRRWHYIMAGVATARA